MRFYRRRNRIYSIGSLNANSKFFNLKSNFLKLYQSLLVRSSEKRFWCLLSFNGFRLLISTCVVDSFVARTLFLRGFEQWGGERALNLVTVWGRNGIVSPNVIHFRIAFLWQRDDDRWILTDLQVVCAFFFCKTYYFLGKFFFECSRLFLNVLKCSWRF